MAATWPPSLQQKMGSDNFSMAPSDSKLRTNMDAGVAKVRRRFTGTAENYDVSIILPLAQYSTWNTFYRVTLSEGVNTFDYLDPLTNTMKEFRMVGVPTIRELGGINFRVTMQWEKLP